MNLYPFIDKKLLKDINHYEKTMKSFNTAGLVQDHEFIPIMIIRG